MNGGAAAEGELAELKLARERGLVVPAERRAPSERECCA
jgi:hypothetical protein